jgi:hypothetical protein
MRKLIMIKGAKISTTGCLSLEFDMKSISILSEVNINFCKNLNPRFQCSQCKIVKYCNEKCQTFDWKKHKLNCKPQEIFQTIVFVNGINAKEIIVPVKEIDDSWYDCIVPHMIGVPIKFK